MSELIISARRFAELVNPVVPAAGATRDLPVLNSVRIETRGPWLIASATDRFRMSVQRIARPEGAPEDWAATIPLAVVKSILATFKPQRGMDADLSLTVEDGNLRAAATGAMIGGFFEAGMTYTLEVGEFPNVVSILTKWLKAPTASGETRLRARYLSALPVGDPHGAGLAIKIPEGGTHAAPAPILFTDGENFVSAVMPVRHHGDGVLGFPDMSSWDEIVSPSTAKAKKSVAA